MAKAVKPHDVSTPASAPPVPIGHTDLAPPKAEKKLMLVIDTTAVTEDRKHEQLVAGTVKTFTFKPGVGLALPEAIAAKFLRHDAFKLVDEDGNEIAYVRPPKQPDELGAGEKLVIAENETVARYDELSDRALYKRVLPIPGGERFATKEPNRAGMIAFIIEHKTKTAVANKSKDRDIGKDDFVPVAEFDDGDEIAA